MPETPGTSAAGDPVANLLAEAKYLDPGLRRAGLPPIGSPSRERFERVRDHYIAYGIRHALMILGHEDAVEEANRAK